MRNRTLSTTMPPRGPRRGGIGASLVVPVAAVVLTGCGGDPKPKPVVSPSHRSAPAVLTSPAALVSTVSRAVKKAATERQACDSSVLNMWEEVVASDFKRRQHEFPSAKAADGTTTTGDPKVYARRFGGGRPFLDPATGLLVDGASAEQQNAYNAWLTDAAVVKADYTRFRSRYVGYLDGGMPC